MASFILSDLCPQTPDSQPITQVTPFKTPCKDYIIWTKLETL
jgi:hypothetical protein